MSHDYEREQATSAIRFLEGKAAPTSGIVETFGHNYAEACRTLVKAAVVAGWIRHPHRGENGPQSESSQSSAHPFAAAMAARRARKTDNNPKQ